MHRAPPYAELLRAQLRDFLGILLLCRAHVSATYVFGGVATTVLMSALNVCLWILQDVGPTVGI